MSAKKIFVSTKRFSSGPENRIWIIKRGKSKRIIIINTYLATTYKYMDEVVMDRETSPPPRQWQVEFFFEIPPQESPIHEEVYESLQRTERSRMPLRNLADCIVRDFPMDKLVDMLYSGQDNNFPLDVDEPVTKGLRLLHFAVFQHNEDLVEYLLERGADPNLMDEVGYTPMHLCAERGYTDLIHVLLRYGGRIRFTELNPGDKAYGDPPRATLADEPLRLAIRYSEHETAKLLLQYGANPNAAYYLGQEINLVDPLDVYSLELLLKYGADPNARDLQGMTPLMKACRNPEAVEAVYLLISHNADVNAMTDSDQRTAMHYAVLTGNLELVEILVQNGSSVRFPPEYDKPPPLYFAVLRGFLHIMQYLINAGADVNAESAVVGSALHLSLTENVRNKYEVVKKLLENGANPNAFTVSEAGPVLKTPLGEYFHSCEQPQLELVKILLKYGARVVLRCQRDDPLGIIKVIHRLHLGLNPEVMNLVVEASESFDVHFITNSRQMSDEHKTILLDRAMQPFSLMHAARIALRRSLGWGPKFVSTIQSLSIPSFLKDYVFYEA